ncbi:MAG: hypothetical protein L0323_23115, partial [Planctomycetes bacterium]|nr:hypothetical protein [Planctomycetota bacterium]
GVGVRGFADASSGTTYGVYGEADSTSGVGVYGIADATSGTTWGVFGQIASSDDSAGVRGISTATSGFSDGVRGFTSSASGYGVYGESTSTGVGQSRGVGGWAFAPGGRGVWGSALSNTGVNYGVLGTGTSSSGYAVYASGDFGGTGAKYFVQPHPSDPSKEIRFVCLEGNESGTYFRGSAWLVNGEGTIEVPEEFRLVTEAAGLTVQVTPVGADARLWVEAKGLDRILVRGNVDVAFDYLVNGVRRGFADHQPIRENSAFVPPARGVPYGTQYPEAFRQILVENGILNPDFTPNEGTAARLGWVLGEVGVESAAGTGGGR